jgi:hypothetical protein
MLHALVKPMRPEQLVELEVKRVSRRRDNRARRDPQLLLSLLIFAGAHRHAPRYNSVTHPAIIFSSIHATSTTRC